MDGYKGKPSQSIVSKVSQEGSDTLPQMSTDHLTWEGRGYDLHQQKGISGRMGKRASEDVKLMLQKREIQRASSHPQANREFGNDEQDLG